ncbi:MAG: hypothetical protein ABI574_10365 [Burkholderiales bacterium]
MTTRRIACLMGTLAAWPLLTGFIWPQFFDLSWDEEVQLHDGRVIVVHLKFTYERLSRLSKYERAIMRNTEMSFDAGPPYGRVTQLFIHQRPMLLDEQDGRWFVLLQGRAGKSVQDWGMDQNGHAQRTAALDSRGFHPIPLGDLPLGISKPNMLVDYAPINVLTQFDGSLITIEKKKVYLEQYPLGPADRVIYRPHVQSTTQTSR